MLANVLSPLAALNARMMLPVHAGLYPFPLATTLHALRVSLAYRGISAGFRARRKAEGKHTQAQLDVGLLRFTAGFLVMAWGGSFLSNYLLNQIPGQLISFLPWINYLSVHWALGLVLTFCEAPSARLLDLTLPILDGATRTAATLGGINMVLNHANPAARSSLLLQVLVATISACGGGISAFTLNVFDPLGWSLTTPPFLKATSLVELTDILAPMLASLAYGLFTYSHPAYGGAIRLVHYKEQALLSSEGGRALVTLVIAACFYLRAMTLHVLNPALQQPPPRPIKKAGSVAAKTK